MLSPDNVLAALLVTPFALVTFARVLSVAPCLALLVPTAGMLAGLAALASVLPG